MNMMIKSAQRLILYKQGLNDQELAARLGMSQEGVSCWRRSHGLPMNLGLSHGQRMELYNQGLCDKEIAEKLGSCSQTISKWRKRNNLPINKAETWSGCPMEAVLTPSQCDIMRLFLVSMIRAQDEHPGQKLDVGVFCHEYRKLNSEGAIGWQHAEAAGLR